jgi:hypothetical protein
MVQFWPDSPQAGFDIAQAFAKRELSEGETQKLIATRESPQAAIPLVAADARIELASRQKIHQLREHELSFEDKTSSAVSAKKFRFRQDSNVFASSSRVHTFVAATHSYSATYGKWFRH